MSGLLLEGGTWNLTGALSGGAQSLLGSTDKTLWVVSLVLRCACREQSCSGAVHGGSGVGSGSQVVGGVGCGRVLTRIAAWW